jgi:hypothetical protein
MLWSRSIGSDEGQVDVGLEGGGKLNLCLLSSLTDTLDSHAVLAQIDPLLLAESLDEMSHKSDIEVYVGSVHGSAWSHKFRTACLRLQDACRHLCSESSS